MCTAVSFMRITWPTPCVYKLLILRHTIHMVLVNLSNFRLLTSYILSIQFFLNGHFLGTGRVYSIQIHVATVDTMYVLSKVVSFLCVCFLLL
jgi:hypothetical protein